MKAKLRKIFLLLLSTIMAAFCGVMVACGEPDPVSVDSLRYDGRVITWTAVEDATHYEVVVDGGNPMRATAASRNYNAEQMLGEDAVGVEIQVTAYIDDKASEPTSKYFTRLDKIEELSFDEYGTMSWDAIAGADEYIVKIGNEETRVADTMFDEFGTGVKNIKVMPVAAGDASFSQWSDVVTKTYLANPANVQYDGEYITWQGASAAAEYKIFDNTNEITGSPVTNTSIAYSIATLAPGDSVRLQIQAIGDGVNTFSSVLDDEVVYEYTFLGKLETTEIEVFDGALTWPAVENATGYEVKIGNTVHTVTTNEFPSLPTGQTLSISVKPVTTEGTGFFSYYSDEQSVRILHTPEVTWNNSAIVDNGEEHTVISWRAIESCGGYNVKVKDPTNTENVLSFGPTTTTWANAFLTVGEYEVSVQAYAENNGENGIYSSAYSPVIKVTRLAKPNAANDVISSDSLDITKGIDLLWQNVPKASGYKIYKDDEEFNAVIDSTTGHIRVEDIIDVDETSAKTIVYKVQALGTNRISTTTREVVLNSLTTDGMLEVEVSVLARPDNIEIADERATWDTVPDAVGYGLTIGDGNTVSVPEVDLTILNEGDHDFGVCAQGNGTNVLPSRYTPTKKIIRLAAPDYIRMETNKAEDKLVWDTAVDYARSYNIYWADAPGQALPNATVERIAEEATYEGRGLFVRAMADYWNDEEVKDIYYLSSKASATSILTKLRAPGWAQYKVNGNYLVWEAPTNVHGTGITYEVYDGAYIQAEDLTAAQWDVSTLAAGTYNFSVRARCFNSEVSGSKYIFVSSDQSSPQTIRKLATPTLNAIEANSNRYTWNSTYEGADYVVVFKESEYEVINQEVNKFVPVFTTEDAGLSFPVSIYAKGDNMSTISSAPYTFNQQVKRALVPEFEIAYYSQSGEQVWAVENNGYIRMQITAASTYTNGYKVEFLRDNQSGVTVSEDENNPGVFFVENVTPASYTGYAIAIGNAFDNNGAYCVESVKSQGRTIKILSTPAQITVGGSMKPIISWNGDANSYTVRIWVDGVEVVYPNDATCFTTTSSTFNYGQNGITGTITKVEIQGIGSQSSNTVSSMVATWMN